jgi:DNA-binding NarL/FixJ family response regulator
MTGTAPPATTTVLTVDDQPVVREGLNLVLGLIPWIQVIGTADNGTQAVELTEALRPDIVMMDLRMPDCDGVEATRRIMTLDLQTRILILTTYADDRSVISALKAGASGYLTKDAGIAQIEDALRRITEGQAVVDPLVQQHLVTAIVGSPASATLTDPIIVGRTDGDPSPERAGLSPREIEVLTLIADGRSNAEIATTLVISEATVKSHVNHLLTKLGARDRAHAVSHAFQLGLLDTTTSFRQP